MKSKGTLLLIIAGLFLILTLSLLVVAKNEPNVNSNSQQSNSYTKQEQYKNKFGPCVVNATKDKTACLKLAQQKYKDCNFEIRNYTSDLRKNNQTVNNTEVFSMRKACSSTLKQEMDVCKVEFKNDKELCNQFRCKEGQIWSVNKCIPKPEED